MISLTADAKPTLRNAHFLKPSVTSIDGPVFNLPQHPLSFAYTSFEPTKWPLKVIFNGWRFRSEKWKAWVNHLLPTYQSTWKKVGIHEAIMSSTYEIRRDTNLVLGIAERWCPETNTFIFPWGEATITLEDIMVLGGFSVLGDLVSTPLQTLESQEVLDYLMEVRRDLGRTKCQRARQSLWMNYFMQSGKEWEHEAFLVMWLSRYVFPAKPFDAIGNHVFSIALSLARGTRIALGPAVLASLYRDLSLLKEAIVVSTKFDCGEDKNDVLALTLWAPFHLVQVWAWERFLELRPNPSLIKHGEPRLARWHDLKLVKNYNMRMVLDSAGDSFLWRPYTIAINNWVFPKYYSDKEEWPLVDLGLDEDLQSFFRCLRVSKLVGLNCIKQYHPHRVAMQFGIDQDLPGCVSGSNESPEIAWNNYCKPISEAKLYVPSRFTESDVTTRYMEWWKESFLGQQDAIRGVVRQQRSVRHTKSPRWLTQSSKGEKRDRDPFVSPGFTAKLNGVESLCFINKHTSVENNESGKNASVPPGFPPKLVKVEAAGSINSHTGVENSQSGNNASVPPGFRPKLIKVEAMGSITTHTSVENNFSSNNASVPPGFAPKYNGVEAQNSDNKRNSVSSSSLSSQSQTSSSSDEEDGAVRKVKSLMEILYGDSAMEGSEEPKKDSVVSNTAVRYIIW